MPSKPAPKLFTKFKIYIFFFLSLQNNKQFHHYFLHFFLFTKHHYNTIQIHLFFTTVINNLFVLKNCIKTVGSSVLTKPEKCTFSADFPSFSAFFPLHFTIFTQKFSLFPQLLRCSKQGLNGLDLGRFEDKISFFFQRRGGNSPPLELPPRVRVPAVSKPSSFLPSSSIPSPFFGVFCPFLPPWLSLNPLRPDHATVAYTTLKTRISKTFLTIFIKFTHHFPLSFCYSLPDFLTFSTILSIFFRFLLSGF